MPPAAVEPEALLTPTPPAPPPPAPPLPEPVPPMKLTPPAPSMATSAGEFAYAPPPPVQPVLIAVPSGFKLVADIRPLPPLPPSAVIEIVGVT